MLAQDGSGATGGGGYTLVGTSDGFRPNSDNTFTAVSNITAQSNTYGVVFTWTILKSVLVADGAPPLAAQKTAEVDQICGHPHVQDFRTEQDQGASQVLYNYAVITVGTDDGAITTEVRVRMDQINTPGAFGSIDAAWSQLVALGAAAA
jgi:hypothetical protein